MTNELLDAKHIHFVGIKGVAMTALAVWAKESGKMVSGSDVEEEFPTDVILQQVGIAVSHGFQKDHVRAHPPDLVIYTGAHNGADNIEVVEAKILGIPVVPHGKALGLAMHGKRQISVAGSHGKTTTTAMIATILKAAGIDPSYAIGCGPIIGLGLSGHKGKGAEFVAEADEYVTDPTHDKTPRFLWQSPEVLVVTNIDFDHPDVYPTLAAVQEAFVALTQKQTGKRITIVNVDDPASIPLLTATKENTVLTYGFDKKATYVITNVRFESGKTTVAVSQRNQPIGEFTLQVPGLHNASNATAASVACLQLGLSWEQIQAGLALFGGTKRRFEKIGVKDGVTVYDDYAHHPKEIKATLAAARAWFPKNRIIAVFQPHTYSRTKALLSDFAQSFGDATTVVVADIYSSARETANLGITTQDLVTEMMKYHKNVRHLAGYPDIHKYLVGLVKSGDIVFFIGAGDIYQWSHKFMGSTHE